jgi:hypothetical protein
LDVHAWIDALVAISIASVGGLFHLIQGHLSDTRRQLSDHATRIGQLETLAGIIR